MNHIKMSLDNNLLLCRLCQKSNSWYIDIFAAGGADGMLVYEVIRELMQIEVHEDDGLPPTACRECLKKLGEFSDFKTMCIKSAKELRRRTFLTPELRQPKRCLVKTEIEEEFEDNLSPTDGPTNVDGTCIGLRARNTVARVEEESIGGNVASCRSPVPKEKSPIDRVSPKTGSTSSVTIKTEKIDEDDILLDHSFTIDEGLVPKTEPMEDTPNRTEESTSALSDPILKPVEVFVKVSAECGLAPRSDSEEQDPLSADQDVNPSTLITISDVGVVGEESYSMLPLATKKRRVLHGVKQEVGKCAVGTSANSTESSAKRRGSKVKLVNGRRSSKSGKDEGLICCDRVGGLKIAPGNAVEARSFESNRPSENSRPGEMEVEGEGVSQQTVAGTGDLDTCMEVYFNKEILQAPLLDHTWTSSLKTKRRIVGPYPIATIEQDVPGSHVNRNTCPESRGNHVSSPPSPSYNRTGSTEVETFERSDLASRRLNFSSANIVSECNDGISLADAISYESDKPLISKNVEERCLSDSSNLTVNSNGLDENGTCDPVPGGEDIAVTLHSPQENSVSSVDGECHSQHSPSTDPDANVTHGEIPLVERESEFGDQGVKNSPVTGDESDVGVVSVKGNEVEIPFPCLLCSNAFPCGPSLRKHMRVDHPESCKKCTSCLRFLSSVKSMLSHLEVHKKEREFLCDVCGRTFANAAYLEKHLQGHPTSRAHECSECQEVFSELPELEEHVKTHLNSSYSCVFCDRTFGNRVNLKTHLVSHSKGRHRCDTCQRSFPYKTLLRAHLREHWKLYLCEVCGKEMHYSRFQRHIRSHEPYEVW